MCTRDPWGAVRLTSGVSQNTPAEHKNNKKYVFEHSEYCDGVVTHYGKVLFSILHPANHLYNVGM